MKIQAEPHIVQNNQKTHESKKCQSYYQNEIKISEAHVRTMRASLNTAFFYILYSYIPKAVPLWKRFKSSSKKEPGVDAEKNLTAKKSNVQPADNLNLKAGEWVEVLSLEEIQSTLDNDSYLDGLHFMPEMEEFCGKKFKVYKRVNRIKLESTGEVRNIRKPTYALVDSFCSGKFHDNCERSCFCLWREEWLRRTSP